MIINGECLNVFCATRPPGHHAGRDLHPMKAVSNGFCILNSVACAALYATAPIADGGLGLSRVCVIDIDVHHGNGTQDILCSTYDPRFLYVSMHAGGPDFNGLDIEDDESTLAKLATPSILTPCSESSKGNVHHSCPKEATPEQLGAHPEAVAPPQCDFE